MDRPGFGGEHWYAVWTRSRHEDVVKSQLEKRSLEVFLPKVWKWSRRKDRRKKIEKPLFPGYLFVRTLLDSQAHLEIIKCHGVVNILGYSRDATTPVPDQEIDSIKILLSSRAAIEAHPYLRVGETVKVVSGPFEDVVGRVTELRGRRRLVVSVDILRKSVSVVLDKADVIPCQPVSTSSERNADLM